MSSPAFPSGDNAVREVSRRGERVNKGKAIGIIGEIAECALAHSKV